MRLFLLTVLLWALAGPSQADVSPIRVMSFNVRFDEAAGYLSPKENAWIALTGNHRRDLALQVISDYGPDLLGLQEPLHNQIEDIQTSLPKHGFYGVGRDDGQQAGEYCGIFFRKSRYECVDQGTLWLNEQADKPGSKFAKTCCARIASWVILKDLQNKDQEYLVLNTHWDHQIQEARLYSAKFIRQRLVKLAGERPIIVLGDLNVPPENRAFTQLVTPTQENPLQLVDSFREVYPKPTEPEKPSDRFQLRPEEGTFNRFKGWPFGNRIDFILHSDHFRAVEADIVRFHKAGRYPSDHFPVTATLRLVAE